MSADREHTITRHDERDDRDPLARLVRLAGASPALDPETTERLRHAARPYWRQAVDRRRRRRVVGWGLGLGMATAAGLLLALGMVPFGRGPAATLVALSGEIEVAGLRLDSAGRSLAGGQEIATREHRASLRLADGTAVRLDRATRLRISADALELASGAVYVDVDERRERPLRVETPWATIRDVGTRFEVRVERERVRVRVRDGLVELQRQQERWTVHADEEVALDRQGDPVRRTLEGSSEPWAWTLETTVAPDFDRRPLGELLAWFEHESGLEVRFADPQLESRALQGVVQGDVGGMPVLPALETALSVSGLEYSVEDGRVLVTESGAGVEGPP